MKILILGGAGFIGFHLAKKLSISNHILIVDNLSRGKLDKDLKELLKNRNVKFRRLDITNAKIKLANNFDFVFNFTAIVGVQNVNLKPDQVLEKNVLMQLASIKIAQSQKKLKKFIFSSTSEIYSGSLNNNLIKFPTPEDNLICLNKLDNPQVEDNIRFKDSKKFFVNRFTRLYPLHFITLIIVAVLQFFSFKSLNQFMIFDYNDIYHFFLNIFFISSWGFEKGMSFNQPIWSVSYEIIV